MLADYVLEHDYPHILDSHYEKRYMVLFEEITNRTAKLFAQWMSVGFAHGKRYHSLLLACFVSLFPSSNVLIGIHLFLF